MKIDSTAGSAELTSRDTSSEVVSTVPSSDGRLVGLLSIAASPGAILISPSLFSLAGFFLALLGLTIAAPRQRILSVAGLCWP